MGQLAERQNPTTGSTFHRLPQPTPLQAVAEAYPHQPNPLFLVAALESRRNWGSQGGDCAASQENHLLPAQQTPKDREAEAGVGTRDRCQRAALVASYLARPFGSCSTFGQEAIRSIAPAPEIQTQTLRHKTDAPSFKLSQMTDANSRIFAVNINLESAIDNVPVQFNNVWLNPHWNPCFLACLKQTFPRDCLEVRASARGSCATSAQRLFALVGQQMDCVTLQAASSLCEWLAGAPVFFLDGFTLHGDAKGGARSLT